MMTTAVIMAMALGATAFHDTFARAETAYAEERYADAVTAYEQLVGEQVHDPVLFYNLGNAYLRLGELGLAIANYERALQLAPGMIEAQTNLAIAVRGTERQLAKPRPPEWQGALFFWDTRLAPASARSLALGAWVAFWALLALRQWRRFPYARTLIVAGAVAAVATSASAWVKSNPIPMAVAIDASVPVRHGTSESDGVRFELSAGDRVMLEETRGDWLRVRVTTTDGVARGWAPAGALMAVGPPYVPVAAERLDRLTVTDAPEPG